MNLHESMKHILDLSSRDGLAGQHYGEQLDKIRAAASDALINADGLPDLNGDTWAAEDCDDDESHAACPAAMVSRSPVFKAARREVAKRAR